MRRHCSPALDARFRGDTAWRYGASVLGPVLTGFAEWAAHRAHSYGTPVVWCPMREGELLSTLVNGAAQARGWNVQAKPIWLSRQVTSLAALGSFDSDSIHQFIRRRHQLTTRQLLAMLHLRSGDVPALAQELDIVLDNEEIAAQMSIALTETPHLNNRLTQTTTAARERLLRALRTNGALDSPDLTLVDLGWGGTIQFQLARVLRIAQTGITPVRPLPRHRQTLRQALPSRATGRRLPRSSRTSSEIAEAHRTQPRGSRTMQ